MSVTDLEYFVSGFYFILLFIGFLLIGPLLLLMHFLMPKTVLEKYFKPPYFRSLEVELFTGIPYAPMRTVMLMWVLAFPRFGVKRKLSEAYLMIPSWYCLASKVFCFSTLIVGFSIFILTIGFIIYYTSTGQMKW